MISTDRGLLGKGELGDVVLRHRRYGENVERLDIIVQCPRGYNRYEISPKVTAYPTNSFFKAFYVIDTMRIAKILTSKTRYNLIIAQDPFFTGFSGLRLKRLFGMKLLVHLHGDFFSNRYWLKERWYNIFLFQIGKLVLKKSDAIRVMSAGQKDKLITLGFGVNKIRVIPTPIDIERFERYENKQAMNSLGSALDTVRKGAQWVLMVGRKDRVKDFETLFSAMKIVFARNERAGLLLVGNYKDNQNKEIPLPYDRLYFGGNVQSEDLPAYYKLSSIVILSSTSESFGKVLVEANACGKPVIATATTGAREIVRDGINGFLVPIGDAEALAKKILELLNNPEKSKAMGEHGKKLALERFSDNTEKIIALWREVIFGSV